MLLVRARELVMFGLISLRVESFQNNVFKVVLLVLLLLFTCGLVTAVAVRFLDSAYTAPSELSKSLQPEKLIRRDKTFKVNPQESQESKIGLLKPLFHTV